MALSLFGRKRHKVEPNTPNSYQAGETWGNGAKGFAFVCDFNLPKENSFTSTPLNFIPLKASPGIQKYQLLALTQGSLVGFSFDGAFSSSLIDPSQYPDEEVPGYGA